MQACSLEWMNEACTSDSGFKVVEIKKCFLAVSTSCGLLSKLLYASRSSKRMQSDISFKLNVNDKR